MTYTVILNANNAYRLDNGDYIITPGSKVVEVNSLFEAKTAIRNYIRNMNIGASSYTGGEVLNSDNEVVAYVSYNGRVWNNRNNDVEIKVVA